MQTAHAGMRSLVVVTLCAVGLVLSFEGCAVPVAKQMVPTGVSIVHHHSGSLRINVAGGGEEGSFLISAKSLQAAIEEAILSSKVFREIIHGEKADYQLDVFLGDYQFPVGGFNMTTNIEAVWNLSDVSTKKTVWQKMIRATSTASMGDAFAGVSRARMSAEGAARENVKQGIEQLSQLSL